MKKKIIISHFMNIVRTDIHGTIWSTYKDAYSSGLRSLA